MRISDWSSDVCSSDLQAVGMKRKAGHAVGRALVGVRGTIIAPRRRDGRRGGRCASSRSISRPRPLRERAAGRSEEHTSELQSLMRISYAVFCLKKKKKKENTEIKTSEN